MKKILLILTVAALCTACGKREKTEIITVASEKSEIDVNGHHECFLVKHEGYEGWELWCADIEGFNYEPGYEYVLKIKEKQNAEGQSAISYVLVKEISKVNKVSENLPVKEIKEKIDEIGEDIKGEYEKVKEEVKEEVKKM